MGMRVRWPELELVLAVARAGSATAAARELEISQSTVSRRLADVEQRLGVRLFDRKAHRLLPTVEGAELVAAAEGMEGNVQAVLRRIVGREARPDGLVRVTAIAPIHRMLLPTYRAILAEHDKLELTLDTRYEPLRLHRGEADIALRITAAPPEGLFGRRVARFAYGLYRARGAPVSSSVIGYPPPRGDISNREWIATAVAEPRVRLRIGWDELHADAVHHGLGIAQVACMFGDLDPGIERVPGAPVEWGDSLWALTHESLRDSARIRVVLDAMLEALDALRPLIEGERAAASPSPITDRRSGATPR
ncbi:MAG: LysR family transcriptional regulator [Deltaproteobacteria bacterium]|nr:LysR family transcriptional regulator [Deltaproteobacteria bacterium]